MTAAGMRTAVYRHFSPRCAVLFEISTDQRLETVMAGETAVELHRRHRIDVLVIQRARRAGAGPLDLLALEIKVSRGDFLADVRDPAKQERWRQVAHRHAYAVPAGLVRPDELPAGSGLLTVGEQRDWQPARPVRWAVHARRTACPALPTWLILSLAYRMSGAEAKIRGIAGEASGSELMSPEDLRAALVEARARATLLTHQLARAKDETSEWKAAFAAQGYLPCEHCGQPVRPRSVRHGSFTGWKHVAARDEEPCSMIRVAKGSWVPVAPCDELPALSGSRS